jgi:hypothetical protein
MCSVDTLFYRNKRVIGIFIVILFTNFHLGPAIFTFTCRPTSGVNYALLRLYGLTTYFILRSKLLFLCVCLISLLSYVDEHRIRHYIVYFQSPQVGLVLGICAIFIHPRINSYNLPCSSLH